MGTQLTHPTISAVDVLDLDALQSNTVNLDQPIRAIRCQPSGTPGAVKITTLDGNTWTTEIAAGETLMIGAIRVWATGTVATTLEGLV